MITNKSKSVGYFLALFLGGLGIHHFYYRNYVRGLFYLLFSWTFVPVILGWIDMLFVNKWNGRVNAKLQLENRNEIKSVSSAPKNEKQIINNSIPIKSKKTAQNNKEFARNIANEKKNNQVLDERKVKSVNNTSKIYAEEDIILPKYQHLKTTNKITKQLDAFRTSQKKSIHSEARIEFAYSSSHTQFASDSIKYAQKRCDNSAEIPLHAYWTTFSDLNNNQLKWYLYWREQALKGNYLDIDLSYIILFVYELINYTFNQNAAFNVSMTVRLYDNYVEKHPKLKNYLPQWNADMLFELGELELAKEWHEEKANLPSLYLQIKDKKEALEKISFTTWKPYIRNYRETTFFLSHKNKIYKNFKDSIPLMSNFYQEQGKELEDVWFESRQEKEVRRLFASAVVAREIDEIHVHTIRYFQTETLYNEITNLFRLAENVTRSLNGENREIKVDDSVLPDDFKDRMMERINNAKKTNERFKTVQKRVSSEDGSSIPQAPEMTLLASIPNPNIVFNFNKIEELKAESNKLISTFGSHSEKVEPISDRNSNQEKEETDSNLKNFKKLDAEDKDNLVSGLEGITNEIEIVLESPTVLTNQLDGLLGGFSGDNEGLDEFMLSLSKVEVEFLSQFDDDHITANIAKQFVKQNGFMLGMFLSVINEKANEYLGDNLVEEQVNIISIYDEYEKVVSLAKERFVIEN